MSDGNDMRSFNIDRYLYVIARDAKQEIGIHHVCARDYGGDEKRRRPLCPGAVRPRGGGPVAAGSLMKSVTLGNVTMSHRTREARQCLASLHSTMIGLPRAH
ncbi:hypothetical protein EVAR_96926_1 [Eumeta japonica]|uniref:Uncharacterized protein n=1 Tax=Eumeta variegata TaxID=151549 RepID=A0A4C2A6H1_EUMVA|nr:hypothetical protein EVAR_96926_1 [Eumeta japonica]